MSLSVSRVWLSAIISAKLEEDPVAAAEIKHGSDVSQGNSNCDNKELSISRRGFFQLEIDKLSVPKVKDWIFLGFLLLKVG